MKRWNWFSGISLRKKLMIVIMSVSLTCISLVAFFSTQYYSDSAKKDFYNIAQDSTSRINHQLDRYFMQLAQSTYASSAGPLPSTQLVTNPESGLLQEWLRSGQTFTAEKRAIVEGILTRHIALNYSNIHGIILRSVDDRILMSRDAFGGHEFESVPWKDDPLSSTLRIVPTFAKGESQFYSLKSFINLVIPVNDPQTLTLNGNLILALSLSEIEKMLGQGTLGKTGYFFIVNDEGRIVYHPDLNLNGKYLRQTAFGNIDLSKTNDMLMWNGEQILVSQHYSPFTNWHVYAFVPFQEMAAGLKVAQKSSVYILIAVICLSLLLTPIIVRWLFKPISRLKELMHQVELGDLTVRAELLPGRDEIQLLNRSFNKMTARLDELVHTVHALELREMHLELRQKEATIQALQNQINPHLLYNTLEIIRSIAFIEEVPTIERMVGNLASVYRYTTKMAGQEVTLKDELDILVKYLDIVNVRFPKSFQSKLQIHDRFLDFAIVKLSIQPLVENSVKYAVEPRNGKASVFVNAFEDNGDLIIEVADNGPGFRPEVLTEINKLLREVDKNPYTFAKPLSLGIVNVHARLVLNYGIPFGLSIDSFEGKGSVVSLRVPNRRSGRK